MYKNKKIVHVVPAYPPNLGGMEQRVKELVGKLYGAGYPIEVITSNLGSEAGVSIEDGVTVTRFKKISFLQTPISFALFFKLLSVKVDVFHIHLAQPFFPVLAAFVAWVRRKPYIIHVRAIVDSNNFFGKIFIFLYTNFVLRFVFANASEVIILTNTYATILIQKYKVPQQKIHIIPNATDFKVATTHRELTETCHHIHLVAVGRVDTQKNYHFMLRTLPFLKEQPYSVTLSIVGSGVLEDELKQYAVRLGVSDMIVWKGRLHGNALESVYEQADIFIHTASFETFGTVLIEAMAKGLPICATKVLGVIDVVEDGYNGLLSDFNEEAFAHNVCTLFQDKILYAQMSANNLKTVARYRWVDIVSATSVLYEKL